jgi:hypothetical protein
MTYLRSDDSCTLCYILSIQAVTSLPIYPYDNLLNQPPTSISSSLSWVYPIMMHPDERARTTVARLTVFGKDGRPTSRIAIPDGVEGVDEVKAVVVLVYRKRT